MPRKAQSKRAPKPRQPVGGVYFGKGGLKRSQTRVGKDSGPRGKRYWGGKGLTRPQTKVN